MKKGKQKEPHPLTRILNKRPTIIFLLCLICVIGLPLRIQNIKLNGYISDDAWWHYRQIKQVLDFGHRLNPDIYEFTTLKRPMTYPPLFHYLVPLTYKLFARVISLIKFTHYFNVIEGMLYILLIYALSYVMTEDGLFSLIGALSTAVSYGVIIRARAGELMPFVPGDLFALAGLLLLLILLKDVFNTKEIPALNNKNIILSTFAGVLFGLSMLCWSGGAYIYLPLILFVFLALILSRPGLTPLSLKLFFWCFISLIITCLGWYLPLILKYGLNPHSKEMDWFMKGFTVLHQVKPLNFYIFTSGIAIFFVPIVFLSALFKRGAVNIFIVLWIILGAIATYSGWRGYVAVVPILSAVIISIGISHIVRFFFREGSRYIPVIFILIFLLVGRIGYHISALRLAPLDPHNVNEVRTNAKSIKMLEYLKQNYPNAITIDLISWVSEDEAVGFLRMVAGQYLEYLPPGSSEALKDVSRFYLADEEGAYNIGRKYDVDLIIVRQQFLQLPQLSLLFAPSELRSDDYLRITKEAEGSGEVTINFSPKGTQAILFRMLNRQKFNRFELVYADEDRAGPLPFVVVYKVNK
jgi:hypothetical protein